MADLAQRLIAENKRTKATFLDLGNCGLSNVPPEVSELTWLQSLDLSRTPVSDLTPLATLSTLQVLDVRNTQVSDLSSLLSLISGGCPVHWSSETWIGPGIVVKDCPLPRLPACGATPGPSRTEPEQNCISLIETLPRLVSPRALV